MKARIVSFSIALLVLFSIAIAYANHEKWTKGPCISGTTITGMATGLGTGPYYLRVTGQYDCVNRGGNTPDSHNWSDLDIIIPATTQTTGGNVKLTATLNICPKSKWSTYLQSVYVSVYNNSTGSGDPVLGPTPAYSCN